MIRGKKMGLKKIKEIYAKEKFQKSKIVSTRSILSRFLSYQPIFFFTLTYFLQKKKNHKNNKKFLIYCKRLINDAIDFHLEKEYKKFNADI